MIEMTQADFSALVDLLSELEEFRTESSRWRLIDDVVAGLPREKNLRALLDLSGKPRPAAVSLVTRFQRYGTVEGQEMIGVLVNRLLGHYIFDREDTVFLQDLLSRYHLNNLAEMQPPIAEWKGQEDSSDVFEKIIGENTLRHIMILELALTAAMAVVQIRTPNNLGSGFLCGQEVIMTNHHVIPDLKTATRSEFTFFHELDRHFQSKPTQTAKALSNGRFFSDPQLDVTFIQVENVPDTVTPLVLSRQQLNSDSRVSIIQHPGGFYKKISIQNNFVQYVDANVVQYTTSTAQGSSGAPVFNDDFEVVAIHHSGGLLEEPLTGRRYLRNAGSVINAVLDSVHNASPDLYNMLNVS